MIHHIVILSSSHHHRIIIISSSYHHHIIFISSSYHHHIIIAPIAEWLDGHKWIQQLSPRIYPVSCWHHHHQHHHDNSHHQHNHQEHQHHQYQCDSCHLQMQNECKNLSKSSCDKYTNGKVCLSSLKLLWILNQPFNNSLISDGDDGLFRE